MAETSSHLRNFAVAEAVGLVSLLDGHPLIAGRPSPEKGPAQYQAVQGTAPNPLAHVVPCNLLLDGDTLLRYYRTPQATDYVRRVFGMGVMAPDDWEDMETFTFDPRQQNIVDNIAERYQLGDGLVDSFVRCVEEAVNQGRWDGSGKRRHDLMSLVAMIEQVYRAIWVPGARTAYQAAQGRVAHKLAEAQPADQSRKEKLRLRQTILAAQIHVLNRDTAKLREAGQNVFKAVGNGLWV